MKLSKELIGLAGEFAVASELCRRGIYSQLTLGHHKQTDILVETETSMLRVTVRAKLRSEWPSISGLYRADDFLVLVDLQDKSAGERPDFYVLDLDDWKALLCDERERHPAVMIDEHNRVAYPDGWTGLNIKAEMVIAYQDGWGKIGKHALGEQHLSSSEASLRGLVIEQWEAVGRPSWDIQETVRQCQAADVHLEKNGLNPAPKFRKARRGDDKKYMEQWGRGGRWPWLNPRR